MEFSIHAHKTELGTRTLRGSFNFRRVCPSFFIREIPQSPGYSLTEAFPRKSLLFYSQFMDILMCIKFIAILNINYFFCVKPNHLGGIEFNVLILIDGYGRCLHNTKVFLRQSKVDLCKGFLKPQRKWGWPRQFKGLIFLLKAK